MKTPYTNNTIKHTRNTNKHSSCKPHHLEAPTRAAISTAIAATIAAVLDDKSAGTEAKTAVNSKAAGADDSATASHAQPTGFNVDPSRLDRCSARGLEMGFVFEEVDVLPFWFWKHAGKHTSFARED